jgi:nucleotide-binding universal stress UspA family protein
MKVDHILFPVDFSEQSRSAALFVRAMARRLEADVVMLNVFELPPVWYGAGDGAAWIPPFDEEQLRAEAREKLANHLEAEFAGVTVHRILAEGDPARQIVCHAKTQPAGLIMMPTHGYGPYRSLLLGSVTAKVLHDAECPVWTGVHTPEFTSHFPEHFDRILCGVERDRKDVPLIRWAVEFGQKVGAEVRLIHVIPGDPEIHEFTDNVYRERLFEGARESLEKIQEEAGTKLDVLFRLGQPARAIRAEACAEETNLVVVGRGVIQKPLGRLRSTAYAIIRESPCPVVSV